MQNKRRNEEKNEEKNTKGSNNNNHHNAHHKYSSKHYPRPNIQVEVPLQPGIPAPNFSLHSTPDQSVSLTDFKGRPVVVIFYPADFSPVCGDELALFNEILPEFDKHNAQLLGISVDNIWSHLAFEHERNIKFPLLSDFEPKGEVSRKYGVYREKDGICERALFLIDEEGTIRWSYVSPIGVNPGANGILMALNSLHPKKKNTEDIAAA
jgi:peroxiredoxin (alkyl hydroperoxide reductase subunit C)